MTFDLEILKLLQLVAQIIEIRLRSCLFQFDGTERSLGFFICRKSDTIGNAQVVMISAFVDPVQLILTSEQQTRVILAVKVDELFSDMAHFCGGDGAVVDKSA